MYKFYYGKTEVEVFQPEDSVWRGRPQRLFCRSRLALQNTLLDKFDSTFPWKVIRKIIFDKTKLSKKQIFLLIFC